MWLRSACRCESLPSLRSPRASIRIVSAPFVCSPGVANARLIEVHAEAPLGNAARLRFNMIRQQTILCVTRKGRPMSG